MSTLPRFLVALAVAALATACTEREADQEAAPDTTQAAPDTGAQAMPGMEGMRGGMTEMMTQMQSHMQSMQGMSADSMRAMMPQHRQMADSMLAHMDREMRGMTTAPDPAWNAMADSVRSDLTRMQGMSAEELQAFMPEHRRRMMALMDMQRRTMGGAPTP